MLPHFDNANTYYKFHQTSYSIHDDRDLFDERFLQSSLTFSFSASL